MSTVTLRFHTANRRLQERLLYSVYEEKNVFFISPANFLSAPLFLSLVFVKYMNYSFSRIALHGCWVIRSKKKIKAMGSCEVYQSELIWGELESCFCVEVLSISQFPDFWLLFWRSLYHQLFIPSLLFYRSVSASPHPTFHAWISFHLTKRAVSQLTPRLGADKYISCAHLVLASRARPISVSITYLPPFLDFYSIKPSYVMELLHVGGGFFFHYWLEMKCRLIHNQCHEERVEDRLGSIFLWWR